MTAIALSSGTTSSFDASVYERRRFPRFELSMALAARLGRLDGTIINISARGACVRHSRALPRKATVRLTFQIGSQQVSATARVISSRLVSLGRGAASMAEFESRLALVEVPHVSEYVLARFLVEN